MICEMCGIEHDGLYGSGRFCSSFCAHKYSTAKNRDLINKKVSNTLKDKSINDKDFKKLLSDNNKKAIKSIKEKSSTNNVKIANVTLDITKEELEKYREDHPVCEICGKPEKIKTCRNSINPNKLAIDHDHKTNKFRGLLCCDCNRKLGWYENLSKQINDYLSKN